MMEPSQNKLGTMPIGKLLVVMSVPMMISMFVQALYNIVDSAFVARINEDALTAVSLAFPIQNIMMSIAIGTGVGVSALVSRSLGCGDREQAEKAANVYIFLSTVYTMVFAVIGLFIARPFYSQQTDVERIVDYGVSYLSIVCVVCVGSFFGQAFEKLLVATGNSTQSMISQATGAIVNIIFDPLFIFGLGPFPKLGVTGAAVATVLGQIVAAGLAFYFNLRYNQATRFHMGKVLPNKRILYAIYAIGFPSMITIGLGAIMSYSMNQIFLAFSTTATAVFGLWMKLQSFGFMPVFGMNNGTLAIYSYNYGAKQYDRVHQTLRLGLLIGVLVTTVIACAFFALPRQMLSLFSASDFMYEIGIPALRLCTLSMPLGACCVILSSFCQALGRPLYSLLISLSRQIVILVPAAWLLSRTGVLQPVWFSPLIAESGSLLLSILLSRRVLGLIRMK